MSNNVLLGIDEAGRGPVIGPLVVCGVEIDKNDLSALEENGIKDSKELSHAQIMDLYEIIKDVALNINVKVLHAEKITRMMFHKNLNEIEYGLFSEIISESKANHVYIDSFFSNKDRLLTMLKNKYPSKKFVVEPKADSKYYVVSAASIVAKYHREKIMGEIKEKYKDEFGDIGSGYPSDTRTVNFLSQYYKKYGKFPDEARMLWSTIEDIKGKIKQKRLF